MWGLCIFLFRNVLAMPATRRIHAWSSPRNISTALMYSFAQRPDTSVVDEPFYAYYLAHHCHNVHHPGEAEILASQSQDANEVIRSVILGDYPTPVVFFKQMTHHLVGMDEAFLKECDHILLIRPPRAIIASYTKVIPQPSMEDVGVRQQYQLFQHLSESGHLAAVVDCDRLLRDPAGTLSRLCDRLSIPYLPEMLRWEAGPRPEDGVWAAHWYANVHRSTGFLPYRKREYELVGAAEELAQDCQPYYETLLAHAL